MANNKLQTDALELDVARQGVITSEYIARSIADPRTLDEALRNLLGVSELHLTTGGTIIYDDGSPNPPILSYDTHNSIWTFSNNGVDFAPFQGIDNPQPATTFGDGNSQTSITLNSGGSNDAYLEVNQGTLNNPTLRFNHTTQEWEYSNDGITYQSIGSGGGTNLLNVPEQVLTPTPPTPAHKAIYPKSDGWYSQDSAGTETKFTMGGSGGDVNVSVMYGEDLEAGDLVALVNDAGTAKAFKFKEPPVQDQYQSNNSVTLSLKPFWSSDLQRWVQLSYTSDSIKVTLGELKADRTTYWYPIRTILQNTDTTKSYNVALACAIPGTDRIFVLYEINDNGTYKVYIRAVQLIGGTSNTVGTISNAVYFSDMDVTSNTNGIGNLVYDTVHNHAIFTWQYHYSTSPSYWAMYAKSVSWTSGDPTVNSFSGIVGIPGYASNSMWGVKFISETGSFTGWLTNTPGTLCVWYATITPTAGNYNWSVPSLTGTYNIAGDIAYIPTINRIIAQCGGSTSGSKMYFYSISGVNLTETAAPSLTIGGVSSDGYYRDSLSFDYNTVADKIFIVANGVSSYAGNNHDYRHYIADISLTSVDNLTQVQYNRFKGTNYLGYVPSLDLNFVYQGTNILWPAQVTSAGLVDGLDITCSASQEPSIGLSKMIYNSVDDVFIKFYYQSYYLYYTVGQWTPAKDRLIWGERQNVIISSSNVRVDNYDVVFDSTNNVVTIAYRDYDDSNYLKIVKGTHSAGSLTFGTPATVLSSLMGSYLNLVYNSRFDRYLINVTNSSGVKQRMFLIDPTTLATVASTVSLSYDVGLSGLVYCADDTYINYKYNVGGNFQKVIITADSISEYVVSSYSTAYGDLIYNSRDTELYLVGMEIVSPYTVPVPVLYHLNKDTLLIDKTSLIVNLDLTGYIDQFAFYSDVLNQIIIVSIKNNQGDYRMKITQIESNLSDYISKDLATMDYIRAKVEDEFNFVGYGMNNYLLVKDIIPRSKFLGYAQSTSIAGQVRNVLINGIDTHQSGLEAGETYYIQSDFTLGKGQNSYLAGQAVSSNSILKGGAGGSGSIQDASNLSVEYAEDIDIRTPVALIDQLGVSKAYKFHNNVLQDPNYYSNLGLETLLWCEDIDRIVSITRSTYSIQIRLGEYNTDRTIKWHPLRTILAETNPNYSYTELKACYIPGQNRLLVAYNKNDAVNNKTFSVAVELIGGTTNNVGVISSPLQVLSPSTTLSGLVYDSVHGHSVLFHRTTGGTYIKYTSLIYSGGSLTLGTTSNTTDPSSPTQIKFIPELSDFVYLSSYSVSGGGSSMGGYINFNVLQATLSTFTSSSYQLDTMFYYNHNTWYEFRYVFLNGITYSSSVDRILIIHSWVAWNGSISTADSVAHIFSVSGTAISSISNSSTTLGLTNGQGYSSQYGLLLDYSPTANKVLVQGYSNYPNTILGCYFTADLSTTALFNIVQFASTATPFYHKFYIPSKDIFVEQNSNSVYYIELDNNGFKEGLNVFSKDTIDGTSRLVYNSDTDNYVAFYRHNTSIVYSLGQWNTERNKLTWSSHVSLGYTTSSFKPIYDSVNKRYVVLFRDSEDSSYLKIIEGNQSGSSIIFNTPVTILSETHDTNLDLIYDETYDRYLVITTNSANPGINLRVFLLDTSYSIVSSYVSLTYGDKNLSRFIKYGDGKYLLYGISGSFYRSDVNITGTSLSVEFYSNTSVATGLYGRLALKDGETYIAVNLTTTAPYAIPVLSFYQGTKNDVTGFVSPLLTLNIDYTGYTIYNFYFSSVIDRYVCFLVKYQSGYLYQDIITVSKDLSTYTRYQLNTAGLVYYLIENNLDVIFYGENFYLPLLQNVPVTKYSGITTDSKLAGESGIVRIAGTMSGFTNLKKGQPVFLDKDGNITQFITNTRIGKASSDTDLLIQ